MGLELSPLSKSLYDKDFFYLNGESMSDSEAEDWHYWCQLGRKLSLSAKESTHVAQLIDQADNPWFEAYQAGWLTLAKLA